MKKLVHGPQEAEPEIKTPELLLNVEVHITATENTRLKEKLEAIEKEKSKLKQQLQHTQNENAMLKDQLKEGKAERDNIQES